MTPRQRRLGIVGIIVAGVALATALTLMAYRENVSFYYSPVQVVKGDAPAARRFRLGGMVVNGSVQRTSGTLEVNFLVTDYQATVPVRYQRLLPNLFKEGTGMVADGRLNEYGVFIADEVLAKHDENYMPPAMTRALAEGQAATPPPAAQDN